MALRFLLLFFITLGLELSDTKIYEPYIRALLGIASHYCEALVLKSNTQVPSLTASKVGSSGDASDFKHRTIRQPGALSASIRVASNNLRYELRTTRACPLNLCLHRTPQRSALLGPVVSSFRALSGRLRFTVCRQTFIKKSLSALMHPSFHTPCAARAP